MGPNHNYPSKRAKKRAKMDHLNPEIIAKLGVCSKHGDLHGALEVYDKVKQEGSVQLKQQHYNLLLYICSGAGMGSLVRARGRQKKTSEVPEYLKNGPDMVECDIGAEVSNDIPSTEGEEGDVVTFGADDMQLAITRGTEIYEDMVRSQVPFNEATFTSVARLAVAKGDGDLAFDTVKRMAAASITPKLRSYGPALLCFCKNNMVEKAFAVDNHMLASGVLPDESLLEALLKVSAQAGLDDKVYSLLHRLRKTVREVLPATANTIETWFASEAASSAGKSKWESLPLTEEVVKAFEAGGGGWHGLGWLGKGDWRVVRTSVNRSGVCMSCGEKLCTIDLDPEETVKFASSLAELAFQRENKSKEFQAFQEWLETHGPYEFVIDGANVGLYKLQGQQNLNFDQLNAVATEVRSRSSTNKSPLIVLHSRRISSGAGLSPNDRSLIEGWIKENALYSTPYGSNDDWYWLYAAVKCKCLLVTNDEMRDHIFQLLGTSFFPKWKERHQVRYNVTPNSLQLHMPPPYSTVIQESLDGSWHIPQQGGDDIEAPREWLCMTRHNS